MSHPDPFNTALRAAITRTASLTAPAPISDGASDLLAAIEEYAEQLVRDEHEQGDRADVTLLPKIERLIAREDAIRQQMYEALQAVESWWFTEALLTHSGEPPACIFAVHAAIKAEES